MLKAGALEEVARLAARDLDPLLPAMKAHGVPALIRHLKGEITLDEAAEVGRADTRHYAKRQFTWFRHQLPEFEWVQPEAARKRKRQDRWDGRDRQDGKNIVLFLTVQPFLPIQPVVARPAYPALSQLLRDPARS
jgi:hypothetical protein